MTVKAAMPFSSPTSFVLDCSNESSNSLDPGAAEDSLDPCDLARRFELPGGPGRLHANPGPLRGQGGSWSRVACRATVIIAFRTDITLCITF